MPGRMTALFKYLVLSSAVSVIFGFTSVRDDANWFKNGQRIKNRFVTGVVNGIVDFDCTDSQNGATVEGECLSKIECTKTGGKIGGLCSLLGSCCVIEKTCNATTSSKISYFVPPKSFQNQCSLTVNTYSKDVCQIRLDFEEFDIAQPTNREIKEKNGSSSYQCFDDEFKVLEARKNLGFVHLCGRNKGQHIYVPIGENQQRITLFFKFADRFTQSLNQPSWKIKIRQLECRKSGSEHLFNAPSKLMTMYNNLKNKKNPKSDWELIAPPNCLQYYHNQTGTFESFNYNGGVGHYIGRLDYAVCFKKTPDICGARYKAHGIFQMNYNNFTLGEKERCHPKLPAALNMSQDYIRIPGGFHSGSNYQDYYCDADLQDNQTVVTKSNEPLFVGVHTDEFLAHGSEREEIGFKIRYDLEIGNCDIPF